MQTISLDTHASSKAIRPAQGRRKPNLPPSMISPGRKPSSDREAVATPSAATPGAQLSAQQSAYAELDAMLIRDPNVGAVHGVRVALLFNAGLALSGLVAWEIWTLIAR